MAEDPVPGSKGKNEELAKNYRQRAQEKNLTIGGIAV
jgi:hypothetical protein